MANRLLRTCAGSRTASASGSLRCSFCASAPSTASAGTRRAAAAARALVPEHLWWVARIEGAEKFETQRSRTQASARWRRAI